MDILGLPLHIVILLWFANRRRTKDLVLLLVADHYRNAIGLYEALISYLPDDRFCRFVKRLLDKRKKRVEESYERMQQYGVIMVGFVYTEENEDAHIDRRQP